MSWSITDDYNSTDYLISKITIKRNYIVDFGQFVDRDNLEPIFGIHPDEIGHQGDDLIYVYQCTAAPNINMTSVSYTHDVWINNERGHHIILVLIHPLDDATGERKKVKRTNNKVTNIKPNQF